MAGVDVNSSEAESTQFIEPSFLNALPHYSPLAVFPLLFLALLFGGWWMLGPFLFMSLASFLDPVFGVDGLNMNPRGVSERSFIWYNIPVWTWAFLWPPTLIFGLWQILVMDAFALWEDVILAILLTMEAQAVFVIGHELVHRRTTWERRVGELLLACASYPQYATEHVYIHHAKVGTPHDVGSAPKGESFWKYFPREVVSNLTNSWQVAGERLARRQLSRWHYSNPFWRYALFVAFWYGLVVYMGGFWAIPVYAFLGLGCVFSMKISNYFQHYGLRRVLLPNGRWEKILPRHSWNADWKFTNWMFFKMQRHADHHAMATRIYPQLQNRPDESPELPGTYGDMMNLVLRPRRWFEKMDPLVDEWRKKFYPEIDDWSPYDSKLSATRPDDFESIIEIFGLAPRLAHRIERNPELLDNLRVREFTDLDLPKGFLSNQEEESIARRGLARLYWTHEMSVPEMREQIDELPSTTAIETAEIVRNWSNDKAFQIGMHVIRENLSPTEASIALSNLAEASLGAVIASTVTEFIERSQTQSSGGIVAIVLGDLASRESFPGVEVELLLVFDGWVSNPTKRLWNSVQQTAKLLAKDSLLFSPVSGHNRHFLSMQASELATHIGDSKPLSAFDLTRVSCIFEFGDSEVADLFEESRRDVLRKASGSEPRLSDLIEWTTKQSATHVDLDVGTADMMQKMEATARLIQLNRNGHDFEDSAPSVASIFRSIESEVLASATTTYRELRCVGGLVCEEDSELDKLKPKVRSLIASTCGYEDFDSLKRDIVDIASKVEVEIDTIAKQA